MANTSCPMAHGFIQKQNNPDGTVTFRCMSCNLSTTIDPSTFSTKNKQEIDRLLTEQSNAFFKANR